MQKALTVVATMVVGIGIMATVETGFRPDGRVASEMARGLLDGLILGSNVWPYHPGLVPADIKSRLTASGYELASPPLADGHLAVAE